MKAMYALFAFLVLDMCLVILSTIGVIVNFLSREDFRSITLSMATIMAATVGAMYNLRSRQRNVESELEPSELSEPTAEIKLAPTHRRPSPEVLKWFRFALPRDRREDIDIIICNLELDLEEMAIEGYSRRAMWIALVWHTVVTVCTYTWGWCRALMSKVTSPVEALRRLSGD